MAEEKEKIKAHKSNIKSEREVIKKINKFVELLKQQGVNISKIILFGSYAKGKAGPDSDIDLVVVSNQFGRDTAKEMMSLRKIALKVDSHIEPVPLSPDDLSDKYSSFSQEINRYGIDIGIKGT
jgi:predicted nucleotidyltransferase